MNEQKYDVVVIGSGIGGLSAGALLSRKGYKILVVESMDRLGGRCSTEEIDGFKCTTGAVAMHPDGVIGDVYKEVGAGLDLVDVPRLWYRIEGKDYEMPSKGAIGAFLDITSKLELQRAKLLGGIAKEIVTDKVMGLLRRSVRGHEKKEDITLRDWILRHTDNELAHNAFDAFSCNLTGFHTYEIPAFEMFDLLKGQGGIRAMGISPRGNVVNAESLADVVRANNGEVWTNCTAKQIIIKDKKAKGVVVEKDGDKVEIAGQAVISNVGPKRTVELAGDENFDRQYLEQVAKIGVLAVTLTHIGSDRPLCLENGDPASLVIVGPRRMYGVFPLTNISPELAPPGQHLLYCIGTPPHYNAPIDLEEEHELNTLDIKDQFPLFEKHGKILKMEVVHQHYPPPGMHLARETAVEKLYNVGDNVATPGWVGTSAAVESAKYVTDIVKKRIKPG